MPINLIDIRNGDGSQGFVLQGDWNSGESGNSVSSAGDMNGDGFDDVIVGASGELGSAGSSYVVFGKAGGFSGTIDLTALRGAAAHRALSSMGKSKTTMLAIRSPRPET